MSVSTTKSTSVSLDTSQSGTIQNLGFLTTLIALEYKPKYALYLLGAKGWFKSLPLSSLRFNSSFISSVTKTIVLTLAWLAEHEKRL